MEIGLAVGGAFLSSALNVLFDRLAPHGDLIKMFQKNKHDVRLLKKLKMTLVGLQAVLSDAENKQASNQHVSQWLNELRDAVDGAENLMEQVNYEALRLKVEGQLRNVAETSNQQVSDLNLSLIDDYFLNVKEKLEDTIETLEDLQKQIGFLGLKEHFALTKHETRRHSTSLVDESDIFGRQNEIEELIDRLLSKDASEKSPAVVPIVGIGGVGKTTLAKAAYNDDKVQSHFNLTAWFCVSEPYDAFRITKGLLQEIGSLQVDDNLNQLQVKLKESLKGKRFLIVLDDMWNENYNEWNDFWNVFVQGGIGSKIIVTTRKESVALMMRTEQISMDTLSIDDSWSLFKRHAFENMDPMEHPEHEEVGKQIVAKCKGLPLALKTLADYPFRKEQVIHLWIANGLVEQRGDERIQDLGNQYFNELRSRSLFERVPESSERDGGKFLMHDLVNDFAQIASSKLCVRLEECQGSHMLEQSRHMSYAMGKGGDLEKLNPLSKSEQLRTLLPINIQDLYSPFISKRVLHNILPNLISLRALSLSHYWIKELPDALFIKLKLLRVLDLSWTEIIKLPDSICALFNLATLLLSSCRYLEELPLQMEKLVNLRHLDISNTFHLKMPLHLSKLKSLQVLVGAKFLLGGLRMEDLGQLHNLYGSLSILELQNVVDRREALKAKMREKEHVEKLSLKWSGSIADNSQTERDILDELRPYSYIKGLQISGYRGTQFPNWLADPSFLKLLVQLSLSNCKDCFSLPSLGQLPCLKILSIREMHRITEVTEEFYGSLSSEKPFNSLERLEFAKMPEWKQWHVLGNGEFPALRNLSIENCPKLMGKLPENLCSLTELRFSRCPELNLETPIQLSSLKWFEVDDSPKVGVIFDEAELFTSQLELMKQIEKLYISDCNSPTSLPTSTLPSTLKHITICRCQKLKLDLHECDSILSAESVPRALTLSIWSCQNLTRFLIPNGTERLNIRCCENLEILSVACVTRMTTLIISECKKLKRLPEGMQELLPSLEELRLSDCPEIESFPDGGLPFTLQLLVIESCKKLVNGRKGWCLQRLPSLRVLEIYHDGSDEEIFGGENWELPCSIQSLTIDNLKTLSSQLLQSLTSLEYLDTRKLPQIQSLLEQGLPSSLSKLHLYLHNELHSLPTKGLRHLT
ncbi:putative disease resistance protein [Capsicum galapagoense]